MYYIILVVILTWPLVYNFQSSILGYLNVDAVDTIALHGMYFGKLTDSPPTVFWPHEFDVGSITPNVLDHLTMIPFMWIFDFPVADNLWWTTLLVLNGVAGHWLGKLIGKSESAGFLAGSCIVMAEPLVREANLHHAPQSMVLFIPLYLGCLIHLQRNTTVKWAALSGICLAGVCLSYWYFGLFMVICTVPFLWKTQFRKILVMYSVSAIICLPLLFSFLQKSTIASVPPPVSHGESIVQAHGNNLLYMFNSSPADISNRLSLLLLTAALLGSAKHRYRYHFWFMALVGSIMIIGPTWNGYSMPFEWLGSLHPFLQRLHWPERWGIVITTSLIALASATPRPLLFLLCIFVENVFFSHNIPLQTTSMKSEMCLQQLAKVEGALLQYPLKETDVNLSAFHHRIHGKPMVNPFILPRSIKPPQAWENWRKNSKAISALERGEIEPNTVQELKEHGIGAVYIDKTASSPLSDAQINTLSYRLRKNLLSSGGKESDIGCALVWWLSDPPLTVDVLQNERTRHEAPEFPTLITPHWIE